MKREDLEKLGLSKEQIDAVMSENGKDIETQKAKTTAAETERDGLKTQLSEASKTVESFKGLDIEGIKKAADDYRAQAEKAQADAAAQIAQLRFGHALDQALTGAKVKDATSVKAHLNTELLKLADDGSISGLKEQLEKIKAEKDYLFESDAEAPKIVASAKSKSVLSDAVLDAARKAAGLKPAGE